MPIAYPLTIYYDVSCLICRSEMETLKETDFDEKLILVDCSNTNLTIPDSCPASREAMMDRIHAVDANGQWINSTDVFAVAYAASGYQTIADLWANKRLKPLLSKLYPWVADNRHWLSKTPLPYLLTQLLRFSSKWRTH